MINPNTIDLLYYPLLYLKPGNASTSFISEWQSPNFHSPGHLALAAGLLVLVATGVWRRNSPFLSILMVLMSYLALQGVRNQPLFALAFLPAAASTFLDRWQNFKARPSVSISPRRSLFNCLLTLCVAVAVFFLISTIRNSDLQLEQTALTSGREAYPAQGARYIATNYPGARMFNEYAWGGYLIHVLPEHKVSSMGAQTCMAMRLSVNT